MARRKKKKKKTFPTKLFDSAVEQEGQKAPGPHFKLRMNKKISFVLFTHTSIGQAVQRFFKVSTNIHFCLNDFTSTCVPNAIMGIPYLFLHTNRTLSFKYVLFPRRQSFVQFDVWRYLTKKKTKNKRTNKTACVIIMRCAMFFSLYLSSEAQKNKCNNSVRLTSPTRASDGENTNGKKKENQGKKKKKIVTGRPQRARHGPGTFSAAVITWDRKAV